MATAVTAELRALARLARLYRDGVDGADQQLADIITDSGSELPDLLGFPRKNLERLRCSDDPVAVLVSTIEGAQRVARDGRNTAQRETARALATALAANSMFADGSVRLPVGMLSEVVATWPGRGMLVFGEYGGVGIPGLRTFFRECRRVDDIEAEVTAHALVIRYRTAISRGKLRIVLHRAVFGDDVVVVPLPAAAPAVELEAPMVADPVVTSTMSEAAAEAPMIITTSAPAVPITVVSMPPPRRSPPRVPASPWASRIFEAFAAAIAGAT